MALNFFNYKNGRLNPKISFEGLRFIVGIIRGEDFGVMSKVQVTRVYQTLKDMGILETKRNGFIVKNRQGLFALCSKYSIDYSSELF